MPKDCAETTEEKVNLIHLYPKYFKDGYVSSLEYETNNLKSRFELSSFEISNNSETMNFSEKLKSNFLMKDNYMFLESNELKNSSAERKIFTITFRSISSETNQFHYVFFTSFDDVNIVGEFICDSIFAIKWLDLYDQMALSIERC